MDRVTLEPQFTADEGAADCRRQGGTGVATQRCVFAEHAPVITAHNRALVLVGQPMTLTFSAWGPFWPWVMSNSTFCPSWRLR